MPSGIRVSELLACALGSTSYEEGLRLQDSLVARRAAGEIGDAVLFPDHPPVLTVGRNPSAGNLRVDRATLERLGVRVFEVSRGGDVTWHGPGQLVGYVICDLASRGRDLHRFLRDLEEALIRAVAAFGVRAERRPGRTGAWVEGRKLASIGVAVRRWVSYHGFALNVRPDLGHFDLINPCGFTDIQMTSLERLLGPGGPGLAEAREQTAAALAKVLGYQAVRWVARRELVEGVHAPAELAAAGGA
jgi:lipoate-protein ligase B